MHNIEPQSLGVLPVHISEWQHQTHPIQYTMDGNASVESILQNLIAYTASHTNHSHSPKTVSTPIPTLVYTGGGGGSYDDYDAEYGWYDTDGGIDYSGSNENSDGPLPTSADTPKSPHISSSVPKGEGGNVIVNFVSTTKDGKPSDVAVTPQLAQVTGAVLSQTPGVTSVNINATTNGTHEVKSDHYTGNAVDINRINGLRIEGNATGTDLALQLEAQALANPNTRYVEGPGGNWVRDNPGDQWRVSKDLPGMDNHVHFSTFKKPK